MLTHKEMNSCVERAIMNSTRIVGVEDMKKALDILQSNESLSKLIHAISIEISMASVFRGLELHEKEQSILVMKDNVPILVNDKENKVLAVVVPRLGKYYMAGTDVEVDIKPSCWYELEIFEKEEEDDIPK